MISVEEMQRLEEEADVSAAELMERAGRGGARVVAERYSYDTALIFAGSGNNAGDGFVLARHLDVPVGVVQLKQLHPLPREQFERVGWSPADCNADLIIDAMLGSGITGELREPIRSAVQLYNTLSGTKVSLDIPTGVNPRGESGELRCESDLTVCFHDRKPSVPDPVAIVDIGL